MLFLWFYHACQRGSPRFLMVSDHINYLTFEDPGAVNTVRRALKLAEAGDLYGAAETAGVDVAHAAIVSEGLRKGMRFSIGAEIDNDPRARPDAQNIVDAMKPDGMIRSVHFLTIEHPEKGADWSWPFDNPEFKDLFAVVGTQKAWEMYVAKLIDDIEKLPGQIVAHIYAPAVFGNWPDMKRLEQYENRVLEACAARGFAIEINTRFIYRDNPAEQKQKYRDALLRLMKKAKNKGVGIAVGSDAHSPKDQGSAFEIVLKLLDEAKINELVFPVAGRLARVALRATKEHLQKALAQEPAVQPGSSISGYGRAELGLPERTEEEERLHRGGRKTRKAAAPARVSKRLLKPPRKAPVKAVKPVKAAKPVKPVKAAAVKKKPVVKKVARPAVKKAKPAPKKPVPKKLAAKKAAPAPKKKAAPKAVAKKAAPKKAAVKKPAPKTAKKKAPVRKKR
jgi:HisJ family histidinol phosphate phosphatase